MNKVRFYLILLVCLILVINTVRSIGDLYRGGDRVSQAQKRLAELEAENARLLREKRQVDSPEFVEEQARNKLGMGKPGEVTVVLPEKLLQVAQNAPIDQTPNWKKWVNLLF